MTFQEALKEKEIYGNSVFANGKEFNVLIVPNKFNDLVKFLSNYDESSYDDKDCINFSSDSNYNLHVFITKESLNNLRK